MTRFVLTCFLSSAGLFLIRSEVWCFLIDDDLPTLFSGLPMLFNGLPVLFNGLFSSFTRTELVLLVGVLLVATTLFFEANFSMFCRT